MKQYGYMHVIYQQAIGKTRTLSIRRCRIEGLEWNGRMVFSLYGDASDFPRLPYVQEFLDKLSNDNN